MDGATAVTDDGEPPKSCEEPTPEPVAVIPTPEDLVARAIAPVKAEYLLPPPPARTHSKSGGVTDEDAANRKGAAGSQGEESKRQLKRERREELKSALRICPSVAKRGSVDACRYSGNCHFSHELAFLAQKPDLSLMLKSHAVME